MSEKNHKEWAPGLVALHTISDQDLALQTENDTREYVAYRGRWRADLPDVGWEAVVEVWGEAVWTGSRSEFQQMRDRAKTPADLLRIAREAAQTPQVDSTVMIFGERYVKASESREALTQAEATIENLFRDLRGAEESASTWCDRFNNEREQLDRIRAALGGRFARESTAGMVAEIERLRARAKACERAPRVVQSLADIEPGIYVSANGDVWRSERKGTIRFNVGDTDCYLWTASDSHDPVRANAPLIRIG